MRRRGRNTAAGRPGAGSPWAAGAVLSPPAQRSPQTRGPLCPERASAGQAQRRLGQLRSHPSHPCSPLRNGVRYHFRARTGVGKKHERKERRDSFFSRLDALQNVKVSRAQAKLSWNG